MSEPRTCNVSAAIANAHHRLCAAAIALGQCETEAADKEALEELDDAAYGFADATMPDKSFNKSQLLLSFMEARV